MASEEELIQLVSPRMRKTIQDLEQRYTDPSDSFSQRIRKSIRGFESEALTRAKEIHIQASIHLSLCEINLWELELKQLRILSRLEDAEPPSADQDRETLKVLRENHSHLIVERENLRLALKRAFTFASRIADSLATQQDE